MTVRLVATDLDGTILRTDGTVSARTVAALRAVQDAGIEVVFVTGRPVRWMAEVAERTGHTGLAVCANGAVVYDLREEKVIERFELTAAVVRQVLTNLRTALPGVAFAAEQPAGFLREDAYLMTRESEIVDVGDLEALGGSPAVKLLIRHYERDVDELLADAREVLGDLAEVTHSSPNGPALLEISAAGVSKATTLARVCQERGIASDDVIAFGDMPNDLPVLAWAGRFYAVANAHPAVLAAADRRTASNDDDGVAQVLERLLEDPVGEDDAAGEDDG